MPRIGMIKPVYAPITTEAEGSPLTYGTGKRAGKAVAAMLNVNRRNGKFYADDAVAETDEGIIDYTIDFESDSISHDARVDLVGEEKITGSSSTPDEYSVCDDEGKPVGFGFIRKLKKVGAITFEVRWYHKIKFAVTSEDDNTKGESITWGTDKMSGQGYPVIIDSTGKQRFYSTVPFDTEAAAWAYLKSKANIT